MIRVIAARELRILFASPLAWVVLAVVQFLTAWVFLGRLELFMQVQPRLAGIEGAPGVTEIVVAPTFGTAGIVLLFAAPLLTMRAVSEERRSGTLALLLAAPVSAAEIALGKLLGLLALFGAMAVLVGVMPLALTAGTALDVGQLAAGWAALALLLVCSAAIGLLMSCLTAQPTVAAMSSFGVLLALWLVDWSGDARTGAGGLLAWLSLMAHYEALLDGAFDSADAAYFLILTGASVALAAWRLDADRLER